MIFTSNCTKYDSLAPINGGNGQTPQLKVTGSFDDVNWADSRDNFVNGVLYVSGHSSSDTYSSASTVADKVISQMMSLQGSNLTNLRRG